MTREAAPVHVVAAVLRDRRGRILLARRTAGRDLAGAWEFPGGKVEPGESPEAALARDLEEELGIRIGACSPLIRVPQAYPHKRIVLDVRCVATYAGTPHGREKQALAWTPPAKLATYPMPPADRPVVAALTQPDRLLVTPEPGADDAAFVASIVAALANGVGRVQLRAKSVDAVRRTRLATAVLAACRDAGAELLLNGDIDRALRLGCGVPLPAAQLRECERRPLPAALPVSAACHDRDELLRAQALELDFALLGPVAATPTHPDADLLGWDGFARLRECVALPIYALGGLGADDLVHARDHGAQGIAAIRALWPASAPQARAPAPASRR
ncbi:MAG: Nudix family hydrolase [Arenimonas sp.]